MKDFSILEEDVLDEDGSVRGYTNSGECPFAAAFKRQYPECKCEVLVGFKSVYEKNLGWGGREIAEIRDSFEPEGYIKLLQGEEFHTQIKFYEDEE